jgi:hypothetical protein
MITPTTADLYHWQLLSAPPGSTASLSNTVAPDRTFTPDVGGSYRVGLVATDNSAALSSPLQTLNITTR